MQVPLFRIQNEPSDVAEVRKIIQRGSYWATGKEIQVFEELIADYIGTEYAVAFNSGTSALHSILMAYGIGQGEEVIVPAFTFIATSNAVLATGAKPVFADIEDETMGLDVESIHEKITPQTRVIMLVHYAGCPARDTKDIAQLAEDHNLFFIEDNAETFGGKIWQNKTGTLGNASMLSFCQNKIITTGEGGAVVTDDKGIYEKLRLIVSQGRVGVDDYIDFGYNFRMPTMNASLGISQIRRADRLIEMRKAHAKYYNKQMADVDGVEICQTPIGFTNVYQMYPVKIIGGREARAKLIEHLAGKGIGTRICFEPVYATPFYRDLGYKEHLPLTESCASKILTLPMFPDLKMEEIDYIVKEVEVGLDK